jgi:protein tyrosine/serine phosphatase
MANPPPRKRLRWVIVIAGLVSASLGGYSGVMLYTGNFHAVSQHTLYRSAQLTKEQFAAAIRENRIKSILNLRGAHPGESWYDDEITASRRAGVKHYDYPLSATRFVSEGEIAVILEILRGAPKPLLIHCQSGADRTGLVAALFRFAIEGAGADVSDRQLSLVYGHFPYLLSRTGVMDQSFWAYVAHSEGAVTH